MVFLCIPMRVFVIEIDISIIANNVSITFCLIIIIVFSFLSSLLNRLFLFLFFRRRFFFFSCSSNSFGTTSFWSGSGNIFTCFSSSHFYICGSILICNILKTIVLLLLRHFNTAIILRNCISIVLHILNTSHDKIHKARLHLPFSTILRKIIIPIPRNLMLNRHHPPRINTDASLHANVQSAHATQKSSQWILSHNSIFPRGGEGGSESKQRYRRLITFQPHIQPPLPFMIRNTHPHLAPGPHRPQLHPLVGKAHRRDARSRNIVQFRNCRQKGVRVEYGA
mmetsp:Transcript_23276/g.41710  ORF Transcript_23276/g.41710 Transcript_23276/m.41710 type:complete len:281 (+) Transcript_23276:986-1828(+)